MHKLKLESLQVQSFETTAAPRPARGTVQAHQSTAPDCVHTQGPDICGETNYADCSGGACTCECTMSCPRTEGFDCWSMAPHLCPETYHCSADCTDYKTCVRDGGC